MSSKKWLILFAVAIMLALAVCAGVNILVDPFGVFGDTLLDWYSYNETNNPRVAKLAYLEEHHEKYDSYIIGSSSAASYSVEELNEYLGGSFYNLFVYGCDTKDYRDFAAYVLEHYEVKHIVLNLGINEANGYDVGEGLNEQMHALTTGESLPLFYLKYAFCNPQYSFDKLTSRLQDTELPQVFDVFDTVSGCYDKRVRDIEKIGDPAVYEAAHGSDFAVEPGTDLPYIEECVRSVAEIRDMCKEKGVALTVIASPVYAGQWEAYDEDALRQFKTALAEEVDYWDFSCTSLSYDSRYFYDATHFRNAVGSMVLAEIFGNDAVYRPENFGTYVTADNCPSYLDQLFSHSQAQSADTYTADVPILLYHHFADNAEGELQVTPEVFASHMSALAEAGYTAVSFQELIDYVYYGAALPDKPVCITMDDGYRSNYELAWPILEQHGMKATIFPIGVSIGKEYYKDTDYAIFPHFSYEQAREMLSSGVIDLQSHTYDMHQWADYEGTENARSTIVPLPGETEEEYAAALTADLEHYAALWQQEMGAAFCALAYPGGAYTDLSEVLVHQAGIPVTLSTRTDSRNVLVRGLPQTLYALCRKNMTMATSTQELLAYVSGESLG